MIVPRELIIEAKTAMGEKAAHTIAEELELQDWSEKDLKAICPFHSEDSGSFIWNFKDNAFKCFGCGRRYGILDHYMMRDGLTYLGATQKLFEETGTKFSFGERGVRTHREYKYPERDASDDRSVVETYLNMRDISIDTLNYCDVQQDVTNKNVVFNYYDTNDVLSMIKYRPARNVSKGENKNWSQKDSTKPLLYNMNRVDPTDGALVLTEGEIDCLAVIESGYKNCVSVPFGANNYGWIEENWDWLEQFDKLVVWSDADDAGQAMRKEVCSRLGIWRAFYVEQPSSVINKSGKETDIKDANEVLHYFGKQKVLDLINDAKELPITGVEDLAQVEDFDIEKADGLKINLEPLDNIVYKVLYGSVAIISGKRGAGKSSFVNQCFVCEPLDQGKDVFYFSGELSAPVLKSWIELNMAGREHVEMKNDFVHVIKSESRKKIREWYKGRIWVYKDRTNSADAILEKAITVTRKYGAKVWILDNLMTIDLDAVGEKDMYLKQKEFVKKLTKLAELYNVLIILVAHPRKTQAGQELGSDDISGSGDMMNLVQYIFANKRYTEREKMGEKDNQGKYRKGKEPIIFDAETEVMKNRYTGKTGIAQMYFDYPSYRFYSKPQELYKRFGWDENDTPIPTKDPNVHGSIPDMMR